MFKRKIELELLKWKKSLKIKKKAMLIKGLRQTGKTFIAKKFANEHFNNVIYINFKVDLNLKRAFEGSLQPNEVIRNLSILNPQFKFIPNETVMIFDEIQECSGARASIKPFMEDGRFDIIATGSLLGIKGYNKKYHGGVSVGFEHTVYIHSMDFEEFLWAKGIDEEMLKYLEDCYNNKETINEAVHNVMHKYFKEYICVGGMPAVVDIFIKTDSFSDVRSEQKDILESYKDDFGKHLNENEEEVVDDTLLLKINKVYNSIPAQLTKENKKFSYSLLGSKASSKIYDPAINWLVEFGLVDYCYNLTLLENPLEGNKIEDIFKLYITDTGLFLSMFDDDIISDIMFGDMSSYKGVIYENIVADSFIKNNIPLYYFSKSSGLKIDFISKINKNITLIEVKDTNGNTKSSKTVLNDKVKYPEVTQMIKICQSNIYSKDNTLVMPYYLTYLIK